MEIHDSTDILSLLLEMVLYLEFSPCRFKSVSQTRGSRTEFPIHPQTFHVLHYPFVHVSVSLCYVLYFYS